MTEEQQYQLPVFKKMQDMIKNLEWEHYEYSLIVCGQSQKIKDRILKKLMFPNSEIMNNTRNDGITVWNFPILKQESPEDKYVYQFLQSKIQQQSQNVQFVLVINDNDLIPENQQQFFNMIDSILNMLIVINELYNWVIVLTGTTSKTNLEQYKSTLALLFDKFKTRITTNMFKKIYSEDDLFEKIMPIESFKPSLEAIRKEPSEEIITQMGQKILPLIDLNMTQILTLSLEIIDSLINELSSIKFLNIQDLSQELKFIIDLKQWTDQLQNMSESKFQNKNDKNETLKILNQWIRSVKIGMRKELNQQNMKNFQYDSNQNIKSQSVYNFAQSSKKESKVENIMSCSFEQTQKQFSETEQQKSRENEQIKRVKFDSLCIKPNLFVKKRNIQSMGSQMLCEIAKLEKQQDNPKKIETNQVESIGSEFNSNIGYDGNSSYETSQQVYNVLLQTHSEYAPKDKNLEINVSNDKRIFEQESIVTNMEQYLINLQSLDFQFQVLFFLIQKYNLNLSLKSSQFSALFYKCDEELKFFKIFCLRKLQKFQQYQMKYLQEYNEFIEQRKVIQYIYKRHQQQNKFFFINIYYPSHQAFLLLFCKSYLHKYFQMINLKISVMYFNKVSLQDIKDYENWQIATYYMSKVESQNDYNTCLSTLTIVSQHIKMISILQIERYEYIQNLIKIHMEHMMLLINKSQSIHKDIYQQISQQVILNQSSLQKAIQNMKIYDFQEQDEYYNRIIYLIEGIQDFNNKGGCLLNIAICQYWLGRSSKEIGIKKFFYNEGMKNLNLMQESDLSSDLKEESHDYLWMINKEFAMLEFNNGNYQEAALMFSELEDSEMALKSFKLAINQCNQESNLYSQLLEQKADFYVKIGVTHSAIKYYRRAISCKSLRNDKQESGIIFKKIKKALINQNGIIKDYQNIGNNIQLYYHDYFTFSWTFYDHSQIYKFKVIMVILILKLKYVIFFKYFTRQFQLNFFLYISNYEIESKKCFFLKSNVKCNHFNQIGGYDGYYYIELKIYLDMILNQKYYVHINSSSKI